MNKKAKTQAAGKKKPATAQTTSVARKGSAKKRPAVESRKKIPAKPAPAPVEPHKVRVKLVRDSFTMPREDFERIARLKSRAIELKRPAKKSELLRAGLQALEKLDGPVLLAALNALVPIKTGRPKKHR